MNNEKNTQSKNFERYKKWYNETNISLAQLDQLVRVGLLTEVEKNTIINQSS